jgi:tetratricopeptide (TPR) repeat protein
MNRSTLFLVLLLAAGGLAVYANSLGGAFCYDENIVILGNDHVQKDGQLGAILTGTYWGTAAGRQNVASWGYRPLTILSYYATRKIAGNDPFWYHFVNVILHAAVGILLLLWLLRLEVPTRLAAAASALFVLHAVHTEAVAQIVGRAELIAALFMLLALIVNERTRTGSLRRRLGTAALAAPLVFAGLLGKEDALAFIPAALAADLLVEGRGETLRGAVRRIVGERWAVYLVYLLPALAFLAVRHVLFGHALPTFDVHVVDNPLAAMPAALRPLGAVAVFGKALQLLVLPVHLSADYGYAQIPVERFYAMPAFYVGFLLLAGVTALVLRFRKAVPEVFFGWTLFILCYLPVSNALFLIHTILGERILYIPSMGFCVALAAVPGRAWSSSRPAARAAALSLLGALLVFHAVRTPLRNADWKDDLTLFEKTAQVSDRSVRVLNNHGNVLLLRGDLDGAEASYRKALALFPAYDDAAVNLAALLIRKGRAQEALEVLGPVLERRPDHASALQNRSIAEKMLSAK